MAATYVDIPASDLDAFLVDRGYSVVPTGPKAADAKSGGLAGTREAVYGRIRKDVGRPVSIRVYTSLVQGDQRDVGEDAMRVVLVTRNTAGDIKRIYSFKRVHRVAGWRKNLAERLEAAERLELRTCRQCDGVLCERESKKYAQGSGTKIVRKCLGCSNYPNCQYTES